MMDQPSCSLREKVIDGQGMGFRCMESGDRQGKSSPDEEDYLVLDSLQIWGQLVINKVFQNLPISLEYNEEKITGVVGLMDGGKFCDLLM